MECDICQNEATYHLCQQHLDELRFPDVFSTADGEYPAKHRMVLLDEGDMTYIGGYTGERWFTQDADDEVNIENPVLWCYLPDLEYLYNYQKKPFSRMEEKCEQ